MSESGEKEIERLTRLIEQITRVDTKLDVFCEQYRIDINELRTKCESILARVDDLEKRRSDLVEKIESNKVDVADMRAELSKWKLIFGAVAFIVSPIVTTIVIFLIDHFLNGLPW